ncbi:MAG: phosphoribosylanthranilate isomerase [Synergistaceae bacterium]|nr:phosphoribosylanthranilate isomerase [Synergistaceae bacterium]
MVRIKICGITRDAEIGMVNELRPDYIGFVFASRSRRFVAPQRAAVMKHNLRKEIQTIGVFVNQTLENVAHCADMVGLHAVQLHGDETEEYICALREYVHCPIIKAFKVRSKAQVDRGVSSSADYVLFDGGAGGGERFDWSFLKTVRRPYFLAGGLSPENVGEAMEVFPAPYALDVSSGVEVNRIKDYRKMMKFIAGAREYKSHNLEQEMKKLGIS